MPGQVAEIIVTLDGGAGRRGSGYRVGSSAVLTAAHVIEGAVSVRVRFDADLPGEWITKTVSCWTDPKSDLAVLTIAPRKAESPVTVARWGRISDRAAVLAVQAVGFPRFKLKTDDGDHSVYRDSHQAHGSVAVLSNRREGTLEVTVAPPQRDLDLEVSPWEGMSGAAVWVGDRIVGVIAKHHRCDGLGRLAAARVDLALEGLDATRRAELCALINIPDVLPDVVPPSAGQRVTTAYQAQVRDIAPDQLLDREEELDELVGFCARDQSYAWWQAGPWAGKSALMAWFVLHPPAGVDVVSFFVTARLAGQSDSDACTDALIEQLAALIGESPAGLLTAGARRGTMLRLLEEAANRAREAGRRLLLAIDGLDEDSGTGPSIAALLPRRPPPEVRVLVASRPHPPIPDDVANDHPLRTITPRQLAVSEHARDVERHAKHELKQLLAGEQLQHDVLGLITAAGGGLTLGDLEQLTERPPFEIERLLGGVFGRSVGSRTGATAAGYLDERVYLFTHETLRLVAEQQYGASLAAHRDRLHDWADTYRHRGWPADTPHYLRRSYPRMLASSGDLPRLIACATDQVRHDRMRDLTGGDALAFTEISTAQQLILAQPDPDLTSLALLAVQREHLTTRNSNIPVELPAVWAMLGQPTRAESLAKGLPDPAKRASALTRLARVATAGGDQARAARLLDEVALLVAQISDPGRQAEALAQLAGEMAAGGDHERAEALVTQITSVGLRAGALARLAAAAAAGGDHERAVALVAEISDSGLRAVALAWLAEAAAAGGDHDQAARLTAAAEALTAQVTNPSLRTEVLAWLARAAAAVGDRDRAAWLVEEAERLVAQITDVSLRTWELPRLARAMAGVGDRDRVARLVAEAERLAVQIWYSSLLRAKALGRIAQAAAAGGDHERAKTLVAQITDEGLRAEALARLARAAVAAGDHDRATRLAEETQQLVAQIHDPDRRDWALASLAEGVAAGGDHERVEALTAQITSESLRTIRLTKIAEEAGGRDYVGAKVRTTQITGESLQALTLTKIAEEAVGGDYERAEARTAEITGPGQRAGALARIAEAAAAGGDHDRATRLTAAAEATAQISDPTLRAEVLARLARVVAAGGDYHKAEALTAQITPPSQRATGLAWLAGRVAVGGDHERADRLIDEAKSLIAQIPESPAGRRADAFARLAEAVAVGGDHNRAETLTEQITEPDHLEEALGRLAEAAAAGGDHDRTEALIAQISNPNRRALTLVRLATTLVETSQDTPPAAEHAHSSSAVLVRARRLLAEALVTSSWTRVVVGLARVDPPAVSALADELQVRWGLDSPGSPRDG